MDAGVEAEIDAVVVGRRHPLAALGGQVGKRFLRLDRAGGSTSIPTSWAFAGRPVSEHGGRRVLAERVREDVADNCEPQLTVGGGAFWRRSHAADATASALVTGRELLALVGLDPDRIDRYPHEFSGGQRQRIGIARAIGLRPRLLVCDEPVSALDVSTQAQIIRLLASLRSEFDLTLIFVAHDLAVVRQVSDRVAVMSKGAVVELGETDALYDNPTHPYTKSLLTAVPVLDPELARQRRLERGQLTA